jgi:hypothetical protein
METGYVAFLDVLGFSSRLAGDGAENFLQDYVGCFDSVLKLALYEDVNYVAFSDSVALTTGGSPAELKSLLSYCSAVMGLMLEKAIPIRGAIAYGSYFRAAHTEGVFVAGKAIVEAYEYEKKQDWVGVMLAPSAVKQIPDLKEQCVIPDNMNETLWAGFEKRIRWAAFLQHWPLIPFHTERPDVFREYEGFAVVPSNGQANPAELRDSLGRSISALRQMKAIAPDPLAQNKFLRSEFWCKTAYDKWQIVARWLQQREEKLKYGGTSS